MNSIDNICASSSLLDQMKRLLSGELPDAQKKEHVCALANKIFETIGGTPSLKVTNPEILRQADALRSATEHATYTNEDLVRDIANAMQEMLRGIGPALPQHVGVVTHNVRLASMYLEQLQKIIASELTEQEKREKLLGSEKKIFSAIRGANLSNSDALLTKVEDLMRATEHPGTTLAEIGVMAKTVRTKLQTIEQAACAQKHSNTSEKADLRHEEAHFFHRPEVARIMETFPCSTIAKKIPLKPKTFAQAKELAWRILSGTYGEELRERLRDSLFSQDDLLLFLLLDGVLHGDDLKAVEIFTNIPEAELSALQSLKEQLTKEHITEALLGKSEKTRLPGKALWTKAVSKAYLADNAWLNALLAHMNAFRLPTPEQLLHIALEVPGKDVRESLRRAVEAEDPEAYKDLEKLLAVYDEADEERAYLLAKSLLLHPLLPKLLTIMATDRPECVITVADAFALLPKKAFMQLCDAEVSSLADQYIHAARDAVHIAGAREGVDRAHVLLNVVSSIPMRLAAKAGFIEVFCDTHPIDATNVILSMYRSDDGEPSPCIRAAVNANQGIRIFAKNKTAQEVLKYAPHMAQNPQALTALFLSVLLRAIDTDIEEALPLFDAYPKMQNENVIGPLGHYLASHGTVATLRRCLDHPSLAGYRDLLRSEFVLAVLERTRGSTSTAEILAIISDMENPDTLAALCDKAVFRFASFDHLSIGLEDEAAVAMLIAKAPSKIQDVVRCFCALGYMRSGKEEEMRAAYALVAKIESTWWRETALLSICQELLRLRPEPSQTFVASSAHTLIQLLEGCDGEDIDTIRSLLVELLSQSSLSVQALDIVRTIQSTADLTHALRVLATAIVTTRPEHYLEALHDLVELASGQPHAVQHCLKAVLRPVASADRKTALELLESVPEPHKTTAEAIIALAEEPSESSSLSSESE